MIPERIIFVSRGITVLLYAPPHTADVFCLIFFTRFCVGVYVVQPSDVILMSPAQSENLCYSDYAKFVTVLTIVSIYITDTNFKTV